MLAITRDTLIKVNDDDDDDDDDHDDDHDGDDDGDGDGDDDGLFVCLLWGFFTS